MNAHRNSCTRKSRGASLVETVIVIAILAAALSVAFPLVYTAQEAARKHQCTANLKQIIHAIQCHDDLRRAFPSGGVTPWPQLEDYLDGAGRPYGSRDQGLGWMYQIAPYVDEDLRDIQLIRTTAEVAAIPVPTYFCPSRRPVTFNTGVGNSSPLALNDYAAAVPTRTREQVGDSLYNRSINGSCTGDFWGQRSGGVFDPRPAEQIGERSFAGFWGVIVRSNLYVPPGTRGMGELRTLNYYSSISIPQITDGLTRTLVVSEKLLSPDQYLSISTGDDRGWTDGWDYDTMRSTLCQPVSDQDIGSQSMDAHVTFGSAHPRSFNAAFADGTVRPIHYEVDRELLNRLAHRNDGEL